MKKYSADSLDACVSVLADAFVDNPLHLSAFGKVRSDLNRQFFRIGLRRRFGGPAYVALADGAMCGYVHFNASPYCLPAPEEIPGAMAELLKPLGEAAPKVIQWFGRWCHLDPDEPHVHLGPIGVAPQLQGQGVGTALMRCYIEHLEREKAAGYLETDRSENVEFYKRFGFVLRHEETVIGIPTWYMWRPR
ncbi:MAG TPA: GNAT family N-acetyltransferase [Candidatus Binatia bacterium]